ncbi:enoyl-CoA hydratase/isomerase family protein [Nocardioides sp. TF02-7]|uniref:enoyl-CoA hydratase/isomerase family protein n=1 Tax=Nocardioides sp. TF02-7 TaxID=2917724 RepID=UPI001F064233|nr:enoyl-CoA hydratase/isomerase family protein [Nocardioides sp. TF02-7]UMG93683.1 enoyl-CoA hydratase/isomerase family protein [Nocardioides sp. TF02-7]
MPLREPAGGLRVEDRDGARHVTLARPPVNALSLKVYDALRGAFDLDAVGAAGRPRLVVLRAEGRAWCAGQDVRELAAVTDRAAYLERAGGGVAAVARCPVPVVAVVDGPAVGAGGLLVACADLVVAGPAASVAFPELRVGAPMGAALLEGFLPPPLVSHALATGATLGADRLREVGAVAEVVPAAALDDRAAAVVADLLALPDDGLRYLRGSRRPAERAAAYLAEVTAAARALREA